MQKKLINFVPAGKEPNAPVRMCICQLPRGSLILPVFRNEAGSPGVLPEYFSDKRLHIQIRGYIFGQEAAYSDKRLHFQAKSFLFK